MGINELETSAWRLVSLIVDGFDDHGIHLHGRIYNQGEHIRVSFVDPVSFIQVGQKIPMELLGMVDLQLYADAFCRNALPDFLRHVKNANHVVRSIYKENPE